MLNNKLVRSIFLLVSMTFVGMASSANAQELIILDSNQNFEQTVDSIRNQIKENGLALVFEANHKNMIQMVGGTASPSITLGFASPQMGERVLTTEPLAGIEMPMRIAVRELSDGQVKVIYYQPSTLFSNYNNPGLNPLGERMDQMIAMIAKAGTQ